MKYKVMECHLSYAIVLSEDGRFLKTANLNYTVGETVTDVVELRQPEEKSARRSGGKRPASLAAAAACLVCVLTFSFQIKRPPYGSVHMAINPSVKIDVNQRDVVIGLEGTNQDGELLIDDYTYKKKELDFVMDELVDRAIDMGFLQEGGEITLTLDGEDEQWIASRGPELSDSLNRHLEGSFSVTITVDGRNGKNQEAEASSAASEEEYGASDYELPAAETVVSESMVFQIPVSETPAAEPASEARAPEPSVSELPESPAAGESDYREEKGDSPYLPDDEDGDEGDLTDEDNDDEDDDADDDADEDDDADDDDADDGRREEPDTDYADMENDDN